MSLLLQTIHRGERRQTFLIQKLLHYQLLLNFWMTDILQDFRIISVNVNGLNDVRKRRLVFNSLKKYKRSIFLLQETHCRPGNGRLWKSQWGHTMFLSELSGSVGGVATLFSKDLDPIVSEVTPSKFNRFLVTSFSLKGEDYTIANLYMPTSDKENHQIEVLKELSSVLGDLDTSHIFVGGDCNVALDDDLDRRGYSHSHIPNRRYRSKLHEFLERLDLVDIWRTQRPSERDHSWSRADRFARLDYIFTPNSFPGQMRANSHKTYAFTDHRMVSVTVRPSDSPQGRGFWKFRILLLNREDYCLGLIEAIEAGEDTSLDLPPDTRWEYLKLTIRDFSTKFSKKVREEQDKLESELTAQMLELEKERVEDTDKGEEFQVLKRELYHLQMVKTQESMARSRVKWMGEGERPTKFFLNLEKKQYNSKVISSVFDEQGSLVNEPSDILKFQKRFFEAQYAINPEINLTAQGQEANQFLRDSEYVLSETDRGVLNGPLTVEELERALKSLHNGKSPGCDGLPPELYKRFWGLLGKHMLASFEYSWEQGRLTPDQRRGVITLIPKKGKDKRHLNNWRPISMLNTDYKILAKTLALRLSRILPSLIHPNQTGFVPQRFIGDTVRNIQSIIDYTLGTGRSALMVSLDFKAAFDSIDHSFMLKALESFQLGENFMSWIATLYAESETCILNSGQSSGWFPRQRGVHQGCPISPFLFVLAAEKLADAIRSNNDISGVNIVDTETKILQFADDSTLVVENEKSLLEALKVIQDFKQVSGLELNLHKTQGVNIGEVCLGSEAAHTIKWANTIKILGINFLVSDGKEKDWELNFEPALKKMRQVCAKWQMRHLSLKGKVVILNTLILPIIYYPMTMLPVKQAVLGETESIISNFLWNGKRAKISRTSLERPTSMGGLGLHSITSRVKTAKITWLKRIIEPPTEPWHFFINFKMDMSGRDLALTRCKSRKLARASPFAADIFTFWYQLQRNEPSSEESVRNESLWGNTFLRGRVKKKHVEFAQKIDIKKVNDILHMGKIMSEDQFRDKYGGYPRPGFLAQIEKIIPETWLATLSHTETVIPHNYLYLKNEKSEWVELHSLNAKKIYKIFENKKPPGYTCSLRWLRAYNEDPIFDSDTRWMDWFLMPYRITHEIQLQSFMFRVFYRVIPCRVYLAQIKVQESEGCPRCADRDDMLHFFFECQVVHSFWDSLATWLGGKQGVKPFPEDLAEEELLLGVVDREGDYSLFNYILLLAKFYIYKTTIFGLGDPELFQFLIELKSRLSTERKCCYAKGSFHERFRKWDSFFNDL